MNEVKAGKSKERDGMRIDWDVPIPMDDGLVLRADVFRPTEQGRYAVILNYGPYGKGLAFQDGYPDQWESMCREHPDVAAGSTNAYQNWETVDPEKWVPHGYACVRVDSRGAGRSPGYVQHFSPRETRDLYLCIEWAGTEEWSNGKVGLSGISYYAMNQWQVAALRPPHLAAMCAWEGAADWYRDATHHGGIFCPFWGDWYEHQVRTVQYGLGERGPRSRFNGLLVCGDETLSEEDLDQNRADFGEEIRSHPLIGSYYLERIPDFSQIEAPLLSAGNSGGHSLHLRGNTEGYVRAGSRQKWLELHGLTHWFHYYTDYGRELQKQFFDHFLKGEDNGWDRRPRVQLNVRKVDGTFTLRQEEDWPIPDTRWTKLYLSPGDEGLSWEPVDGQASVTYSAIDGGITFTTAPLENETEITGPVAAKLWLSSATEDADLFLILRVFDPDGREFTYQGQDDPHTPISHGWLRASHRRLDPTVSTEYRPFHTHDEPEPLVPGEIYELDVEIWPSCVMVPAGWRLALTVQGRDYEYAGADTGQQIGWMTMRGVGPFAHDDPDDRPSGVFGGHVTLHAGGGRQAYILLPIVAPP